LDKADLFFSLKKTGLKNNSLIKGGFVGGEAPKPKYGQ